MKIEKIYLQHCEKESSINEHLPVLRRYASGCKHITEMGTRGIVSTWAFLAARPERLVCVDIADISKLVPSKYELLVKSCEKAGVDFEFRMASTLDIKIERTDLLFIDTEHSYKQLRAELALHARKAKKYIILHDTVTFGRKDSKIYGKDGRLKPKRRVSVTRGLMPAVEEFLSRNKKWRVVEDLKNNNGLMVLGRI